jgi:hypothetical protein
MRIRPIVLALLAAGALAACGGGSSGGGGPAPGGSSGPRNVHITWFANHEKGVNSAGGGYRVSITGQAPVNLPSAQTSYDIVLSPGSYVVTVQAFALLDAQGGATGSISTASTTNVTVP